MAVKAFNRLKLKLTIIGEGSQGKYLEKISSSNIKFLGFQPDEVVKEYYQNCRAFVFPTFDEDFGITPVEAMACGKPVIAAARGGTQESIIAGKTGEFFKKNNPESLIKAVNKFIAKEKQYNPDEIRQQAEKFSKEIFKKKIKDFVSWAVENYNLRFNLKKYKNRFKMEK
jgi:glycosyltransferase involved in cell wall biosynthesis